MAGTVPLILQNSITGIAGLQSRPVFFLNLNNSPQPALVVKGEPQVQGMTDKAERDSIKWSSKIMKNVNNDLVNTKLMGPPEISRFKRAAAQTFPANSAQMAFANGPYLWVKMPFVAGLTDAEMFGDNGVDGEKIEAIVTHFLKPAVWRELGKVVAADLFSGNNDRFMIQRNAGGDLEVSWANYGNIMFLNAGATPVIGLDTFDPSGGSGRSNLSGGGGYDDNLGILRSDVRRAWFATEATKAVASEIVRRMPVDSFAVQMPGLQGQLIVVRKSNLDGILAGFVAPFKDGLDTGALALRNYLVGKKAQYAATAPARGWVRAQPGQVTIGRNRAPAPTKSIPEGVIDRMRFMGWTH